MAEVTSIVYKPKSAEQLGEGYTRVALSRATLIAEHGIDGDLKGGSNNRQLNVMSAETVAELSAEGYHTEPGQLGEQVVVRGINVNRLQPGDQLQIGDRAIIEMVELRTGCAKLERYQNRPRSQSIERLGIIARVLVGGQIRIGDPVTHVFERVSPQPQLPLTFDPNEQQQAPQV